MNDFLKRYTEVRQMKSEIILLPSSQREPILLSGFFTVFKVSKELSFFKLFANSISNLFIYLFINLTVTSSHYHWVGIHHAKKLATVKEKHSLRKKRKTENFSFMPFKL